MTANTEPGTMWSRNHQLDITMVYVRSESGGLQGNLLGDVGPSVVVRLVREERERQ